MTSPAYYKTARLSPLSLKYYGICMRKGNYTVQLHFAEIMFSNDHTYSNNGIRIFDVAIQVNISSCSSLYYVVPFSENDSLYTNINECFDREM